MYESSREKVVPHRIFSQILVTQSFKTFHNVPESTFRAKASHRQAAHFRRRSRLQRCATTSKTFSTTLSIPILLLRAAANRSLRLPLMDKNLEDTQKHTKTWKTHKNQKDRQKPGRRNRKMRGRESQPRSNLQSLFAPP